MATSQTTVDPVRATLIAILQQLNQAEEVHEGNAEDQALELAEIERRLADFWAVERGEVKLPLAMGLLVRNRLVQIQTDNGYSWQRQRTVTARYQITAEGKKFLVEAVEKSDRIA